ncbi:Protein CBG01487 [Caenorhabditis briggsae]|uniref:Protein CBG01487 n=1 Tax=Caenorhabditis briggsae TaxID=6238 RepID=A8WQK7_CAEBR|nr:Protein CBG01487 [Caenorhabditis briggsae]CAP22765.2 Protein CBG01487 [Caenorhabditis briggsae]
MDEEIRELTESRGLLDPTPRRSVFVEEKHENQKTVTTTTNSTETNRTTSSRVEVRGILRNPEFFKFWSFPVSSGKCSTAMFGRVINIIYLQNGMYSFERDLSTSMILNDMFGIPNIPMPPDQMISNMTSFINSIRSLPDVEGSFLTNNQQKLQSWEVAEKFNCYGIQEKSVIDEELDKLEKLNSLKLSDNFISKDMSELPSKIEDQKKNGPSTDVQQALENIKGSISRIKEKLDPWIQVVDGSCTSDTLMKDVMNPLVKYEDFFTQHKDILESLESFLKQNNNTLAQLSGVVSSEDFKTPLRTSQSLAAITNALYLHDPSESKCLPAFPRGIKDTGGIWDSFSDPWIMESLNQKGSLDTLRESLRPVMELMRQMLEIDKVWTDKKKEDMIEGIGKELKILSDLDSIYKSSTVDYEPLMTVAKKWKQIHDESSLFKLPSRKVFDEFLSLRKIICEKYGKIFNSTEIKTFSDSEVFDNLVENEEPNVLYDSDDLRSIGTSTLSTQSDASDYLPSTRSDRTMWPETEDSGDMVYPEEKPENFEVIQGVRAAFIHSNILEFTGLDEETYFFEDQRYLKEKWGYEKKVQDAEEVVANGGITQQERDQNVYAAWDRLLAFDAKEILCKNTNNKEMVRVMVIMENMDQKELEVEKKSRTGKLEIATIAWVSVDRIDNYIHASYQDKWDHIYRCYSPRHCHDWCRVRMSSDAVDDIDFYNACWVYPWLDLYHKVYKKFKNKLICAASPLHNCTVGVLWHWLYENKVKFMLVLDKQLKRNIQSSADWFPKKVGEILKVRRNREREYFIRFVKARRHPDGNGIERKFIITFSRFRQRVHARSIKIFFMDDWDQDSMPEKWQLYIVLCERIAVSSVEYPVVVMSKHGSGRAMTVILSVMTAIMAHYDNDVGIHSMVQSGRASKRQAIVVFNQVYIWRQLHYDLLFLVSFVIMYFLNYILSRFFFFSATNRSVTFVQRCNTDCTCMVKNWASIVTRLSSINDMECGTSTINTKFNVTNASGPTLNTISRGILEWHTEERWIQEKRNGQTEATKMMQAYEKKPKRTAAYFYDNETPVRRRWLRKDDKKRDKKRKATGYVEKKDHTFAESAACERYDFLIPQHKLEGRTHLTNVEDIGKRRKLGAEYVDTWTVCLDKENQKGIIKPEDRIVLPWRPKLE